MLHIFLKRHLKDTNSRVHWIIRGLLWATSTYLLLLGLRYAEHKSIKEMVSIIGIGVWLISGIVWGLVMQYIHRKLRQRAEKNKATD